MFLLECLAEGTLTLTTVRLLAPHLTDANHETLLAEAHHRSKRDVEHIIARLHPQPDVPASVRKLPTPATAPHAVAPATATDAPSNKAREPATAAPESRCVAGGPGRQRLHLRRLQPHRPS